MTDAMPICTSIMEEVARLREAGSEPQFITVTMAEWIQLREELGRKSAKVNSLTLWGVPIRVAKQ